MMDIKVETFLCVCKYMNYTRAAEELHITQSAVSQQIKGLEYYYGTKLFKYSKRNLSLTESGVFLRRYMEAMFNDTMRIKAFFSKNNNMPALKIGATMSVGDFFLPEFFADFMQTHPETDISVTRLDTKDILAYLNSGDLDFAFVEGYVNKAIYAVKAVKEEPIVLVCGKDFPLKAINSIEDLFEYTMLMREEGSGTREIFLHFLEDKGYCIDSFKRCSTFNSPLIIKKLVLKNCGISAMYKTVVADCLKKGLMREIKISGLEIFHDFTAIWRKESLYREYYESIINELIEKIE